MSTLITILHVIVCLFLMLTVLLQSGKGGGMGAAFGGGNAATVFGGSGASQFLRRLTAGAGTVFILTSILLAFLASHNNADALEKFGEQQEKLALEKEAAKKKAAQTGTGTGSGSSAGSAAGSASQMLPFTPNQGSGSAASRPRCHPDDTSRNAADRSRRSEGRCGASRACSSAADARTDARADGPW